MLTIQEEVELKSTDAISDFLVGIGVNEGAAREAAWVFQKSEKHSNIALMDMTAFEYIGAGFANREVAEEVFNKLQEEKRKNDIPIGEESKLILGADSFSTIEQLWKFPEQVVNGGESFEGCFEKIRRKEPPKCYKELARAVEAGEFQQLKEHIVHITKKSTTGSVSTRSTGTDGGTNTKCIRHVPSIFDHTSKTCSRAHQMVKAPECAFFYGLPAEGIVGVRLDEDEQRQHKQQLLVYGVNEFETTGEDGGRNVKNAIHGLRNRKNENMLAVNLQHLEYFDSLTKGNLVVLPICDSDFIQNWQQGEPYDVLVVGSNEATYNWMAVNKNTKGLSKADPEDIKMATTRAEDFTKGLLDLLLNNSQSGRDSVRAHINKNKKVILPVAIQNVERAVLKVSLKDWPSDEYPDPFLVAQKGAVNLYWQGSGILRFRLLPACPESLSDDATASTSGDTGDEEEWYIPLNTPFSIPPNDIQFYRYNTVTDDEDSVSDVSDKSNI